MRLFINVKEPIAEKWAQNKCTRQDKHVNNRCPTMDKTAMTALNGCKVLLTSYLVQNESSYIEVYIHINLKASQQFEQQCQRKHVNRIDIELLNGCKRAFHQNRKVLGHEEMKPKQVSTKYTLH
jgi:hypothetical protein